MTHDIAVVEFVPHDDPMFRKLLRGRDGLYDWFTTEAFENTCRQFFRIEESWDLANNGRRIYMLVKP